MSTSATADPSSAERPRLGPIVGTGVVVLVLGAWYLFRPGGEKREPEVEETPATDDRVAWLVAPCGFTRPFDADTSDIVPILVETLARGQADPIKYARMELARLGERVLPELERRFDKSYAQGFEQGILENVLGVCTIAEEPWGLPLLRRGVRHPGESVRMGAVAGLKKHGGPEDYDDVLLCMQLTKSSLSLTEIVGALHDLDRERFGRDVLGWLVRDENSEIWIGIVPWLADIESPETIAQLLELSAVKPELIRPYLQAPAARSGDEAAIASLREQLASNLMLTRSGAMRALGSAGLGAELSAVLEFDDERGLRREAASWIASLPAAPETSAWLSLGLSDADEDVRAVCLRALCARNDPRAVAESLELLRGDARSREQGIQALRMAFAGDPDLPERALEFTRTLIETRGQSDTHLLSGLLQVVSQIPGQATAAYLLELGRKGHGRLGDWRMHRFCVHQAINSGPEGRAYLMGALAEEHDVLRRLDLIEAITQDSGPAQCELLRGIVDDATANPHERVFAAYRLIRQGVSGETAPFLKRAYLASTDPVVRPALHCLLWAWYGATSER